MDHERPTPQEAASALAELEAGRRTVVAEEWRGLPWQLAAQSALTLLDYAAKDLVPDPRARWAVTAACQVTGFGLALTWLRDSRVNPYSTDERDLGPQAAAPLVGTLLAWVAGERLLVAALRHSSLRRPNVVAGLALAATRPLAHLVSRQLLPQVPRG